MVTRPGLSWASPPAPPSWKKKRSASVIMVWPYFTVLSFLLERGRVIISALLAVQIKKA